MKSFGLLISLGVLSLWLGTGCASNKPGSSSHAYLQITNQTTADIVAAIMAVYVADGFAVVTDQPGQLTFQRPASRRDVLKYGGWLNQGMVMEIKVRFTPLDSNVMLLQADVYSVQNPNDPAFRTESRIATFDRRPYQAMLNKVRDRLEKPQ